MTRITKFGIVLGLLLFFANTTEAATLFFVPTTGEAGVGKEISVDLKIDSEGTGLNAAQATLRFPKDTLTVKSIDKTNSTFNFWLEEPTFSNDDGVISFVGGTPYGISGASLQVIHIIFTSKGSGTATLNIADAAVTASDGTGTNILSKTNDAVFTISPVSTTPTAIPATIPLSIIPAPTQIVREVVLASGIPGKPVFAVPLYPDPANWYNLSNVFAVNFTIPRDISGISTAINKQSGFVPKEESEGLFDSKTFAALSDGIWYLHVRFRNSAGWGATTHYRLAIDTQPPLPFEITSGDGESSDSPTPVFSFKTGDPTSGLSRYRLKVDKGDWTVILAKDHSGTFKLASTGPGKHHILVEAIDFAGNSIENTIDHEIIALPAPTFTFVTSSIFSEEAQGVTARGTALPSTEIILSLKQGESLIKEITVPVDAQGNWEFTFDNPLRNGSYLVSIQNRDARGALSFVIDSPKIQVTGKYTNLIIVVIVVLIVALFGGFWFYEKRLKRTALRIGVAESDTAKVFKMIETDMEKLSKARATPTPADDEFAAQRLEEDVKKMGGYIKEEIKKAKQ